MEGRYRNGNLFGTGSAEKYSIFFCSRRRLRGLKTLTMNEFETKSFQVEHGESRLFFWLARVRKVSVEQERVKEEKGERGLRKKRLIEIEVWQTAKNPSPTLRLPNKINFSIIKSCSLEQLREKKWKVVGRYIGFPNNRMCNRGRSVRRKKSDVSRYTWEIVFPMVQGGFKVFEKSLMSFVCFSSILFPRPFILFPILFRGLSKTSYSPKSHQLTPCHFVT